MSVEVECLICRAPGAVRQLAAQNGRPSPVLCDVHWREVQTDWLLLGWCTDHWGEALQTCAVHGVEIQPL